MNNMKYESVDSLVVESVTTFAQFNSNWVGTMTDLSNELVKIIGRKNSDQLPGSPSALRKVIDRNINKIRKRKISLKFVSRKLDRTRRLMILTAK